MRINLLDHPLATPEWESLPATPIRLATRALWANNSQGEEEAPDHRVIHSRAAFAASPMSLESFRRAGAGYHKCASGQEVDAPMHVVLRVPDGQEWRTVADVRAERNLLENEGLEVDLAGLRTTALVAEVREAATDRWWQVWNLATTGLQLYGEPSEAWQPSPQGKLEIESLDLARMPAGVEAAHLNSEVRFRAPFLELGFRLSSPSWSYMGLDSDGGGKTAGIFFNSRVQWTSCAVACIHRGSTRCCEIRTPNTWLRDHASHPPTASTSSASSHRTIEGR